MIICCQIQVVALQHDSQPAQLARAGVAFAVTATKAATLAIAWLGVVPLLLGLLFELLVLVPICPLNEGVDPRVFSLYQVWAVGLLLLKLWHRLAMTGVAVPPTPPEWVTALMRFHEEGLATVDARWMLHNVLIPLIGGLAVAIALPFVPYALCNAAWTAISPATKESTFGEHEVVEMGKRVREAAATAAASMEGKALIASVAEAIRKLPLQWGEEYMRFAHLIAVVLIVGFDGSYRIKGWFHRLHNNIRDDCYLVGRKLQNFPGHSL